MRKKHLKYLVCPTCRENLQFSEITRQHSDVVETGTLVCSRCKKTYKIREYIPRFVPLENYAGSFGFEWIKHAKTQYDSYSGVNISQKRFFAETKWSRDLEGEIILEVGGGPGRFTEHAVSTGAMVMSVDLSYAVEANYASNGHNPNLLIAQADMYELPFREASFDKVVCIGVLQHTPDVKKSFMALPKYLKPGGKLVIDVYRKRGSLKGLLQTRRWVRPLVKNISSEKLYTYCARYVKTVWPIVRLLAKLPYLGKRLIWILLLIPYYDELGLSDKMLKEWAILDLFDILSARYESPQTIETVQQWFAEADFKNVEVHYGYNGIEGRGVKA